MVMKKFSCIAMIFFLFFLLPVNVMADLVGDTVTVSATWNNPVGLGNPPPVTFINGQTAVVSDPGVEFSSNLPGLSFSPFSIDLADSSINVVWDPTDLAQWPADFSIVLSDLDWVGTPGRITGVAQTANNSPGWLSEITFGDDFINLDSPTDFSFFRGFPFDTTFSITVDHGPGPGPGPNPVVPEPSTVLLFGSGLAGLLAWRYKNINKPH